MRKTHFFSRARSRPPIASAVIPPKNLETALDSKGDLSEGERLRSADRTLKMGSQGRRGKKAINFWGGRGGGALGEVRQKKARVQDDRRLARIPTSSFMLPVLVLICVLFNLFGRPTSRKPVALGEVSVGKRPCSRPTDPTVGSPMEPGPQAKKKMLEHREWPWMLVGQRMWFVREQWGVGSSKIPVGTGARLEGGLGRAWPS